MNKTVNITDLIQNTIMAILLTLIFTGLIYFAFVRNVWIGKKRVEFISNSSYVLSKIWNNETNKFLWTIRNDHCMPSYHDQLYDKPFCWNFPNLTDDPEWYNFVSKFQEERLANENEIAKKEAIMIQESKDTPLPN